MASAPRIAAVRFSRPHCTAPAGWVEGAKVPRQRIPARGNVAHSLTNALVDGLLQLQAVLGGHSLQNFMGAGQRGLVQEPLMEYGRHDGRY
jgi:hypothetical protein